MYRVISFIRGAAGSVAVLLMAAFLVLPASLEAAHRPHIDTDRGGGGGGIVITTEGDPTDSNDVTPDDLDPTDDPITHGDIGGGTYSVGGAVPDPGPSVTRGWFVYLVIDYSRGVPVPVFRLGGLTKARGD